MTPRSWRRRARDGKALAATAPAPAAAPGLPADVNDPRTRLAKWLASPEHPPSARVIVDRVWAHHHARARRRTMFQMRAARPGEFAEACFVERRGGFYKIVGPRRTWQAIEMS